MPMRLAKTLSIQTGRKLSDRSREDIVKTVSSGFKPLAVVAIQIGYEVIRVTFGSDDDYKRAMEKDGIRLFGLYCKILGGGPPITMVHVFDYPYEEEDDFLVDVFRDFGQVKGVKKQTYLFDKSIYTGTRLVSLVLKGSPPRSLTINGYLCRVWFKGQPLVCNLCGVQGHKSSACPNRDKCRRCGQSGHFARACPRTFDADDENRVSVIVAGASDVGSPPPSSGLVSAQNLDRDVAFSGDSESASGAPPPPLAAEDSLASVADPVEDCNNISGVSLEESPVRESSANPDDAYAFTCGQAVPDSQVSLLSSPAPSPTVEDASPPNDGPKGHDVVSGEDPASSQSSSADIPGPMDQSSTPADNDPPAASGLGKLVGKLRNRSLSSRKAPYPTGSRHVNLPTVVSDRPKPGHPPNPKR